MTDAGDASSEALGSRLRLRTLAEQQHERRRLGFTRQPQLRWLSPGMLARAGLEVVISAAFGKFADKREIETTRQGYFDYSKRAELGIDFLSDTGDGFDATYTMAWLLAQESLAPPGAGELPRGDVLLLGGDQVYPSAGAEAYRNHFTGPFEAAFPRGSSDGESGGGAAPDLYAIPGNHDWYDGLGSFLRLFCRPGPLGGWQKHQTRSYFALRLAHGWWVWAIDIQFDTYIDTVQLDYFAQVAEHLEAGDNVVLLTAKPSWVHAERGLLAPPSWRNLAYFEQTMIREKGARPVLTLTGDIHHYSRYEPEPAKLGEHPVRITAGGGGAYMSPTHTLPQENELTPWEDEPGVHYTCERTYPERGDSKRMSWGVFRIPVTNPGFAGLLAAIYALLGAAMVGALNVGDGGIVAQAARGGFLDFLGTVFSGTTVILVVALCAVLVAYADFRTLFAKLPVGVAHAAGHFALAALGVYATVEAIYSPGANGLGVWVTALALCAGVGFLAGSELFALVLFTIHRLRGAKAGKHTNEVFASQSIVDYKNLLRIRLAADGRLTVHSLGVRRVGRRWRESSAASGPAIEPDGEPPAVTLIDDPRVLEPPRPSAAAR